MEFFGDFKPFKVIHGIFTQYKKRIIFTIIVICTFVGNFIYQKIDKKIFVKEMQSLQGLIKNKEYGKILEIFKRRDSSWISNSSIFTKTVFYFLFSDLIKKQLSKDYLPLIEKGNWLLLIDQVKKDSTIKEKDLILDELKCLESIYQFMKNKNPYSCVLSPKQIDYYGERLNIIIFEHIINREEKEVALAFYWINCLEASIFQTEARILFNKARGNLNESDRLIRVPVGKDKKARLSVEFINF